MSNELVRQLQITVHSSVQLFAKSNSNKHVGFPKQGQTSHLFKQFLDAARAAELFVKGSGNLVSL